MIPPKIITLKREQFVKRITPIFNVLLNFIHQYMVNVF